MRLGPMPCLACRKEVWWDPTVGQVIEMTGTRHACPKPPRTIEPPKRRPLLKHGPYFSGRSTT